MRRPRSAVSRGRDVGRPAIADGSGHTRQTLVVGRGPAALAAAGFLDQAGLTPVVAGPAGGTPAPPVVVLWRPGLELLERLGLRRPVEAIGTPLTALQCEEPPDTWTGKGSSRPHLVALRRDRLVEVTRRHLAGRFRSVERPVVSVESTDAGVRATFEGGIDEQFDAVATTERDLLPGHRREREPTTIHWWSFDWPATVPAPDIATEMWGESCAAFTLPVGESARALLVATDSATPGSPLSTRALGEQFSGLSESLGDALAELDRQTLQYGRRPYVAPRQLCAGGVALVGSPARASIPGDCLGPALAVEDSWVLADALAYGPASTEEALIAYAERRRWRSSALTDSIHDVAGPDRIDDRSGLPPDLCARRSIAFGHLFDSADQFVRDVPDQL